jgi:hypothetical protein
MAQRFIDVSEQELKARFEELLDVVDGDPHTIIRIKTETTTLVMISPRLYEQMTKSLDTMLNRPSDHS